MVLSFTYLENTHAAIKADNVIEKLLTQVKVQSSDRCRISAIVLSFLPSSILLLFVPNPMYIPSLEAVLALIGVILNLAPALLATLTLWEHVRQRRDRRNLRGEKVFEQHSSCNRY